MKKILLVCIALAVVFPLTAQTTLKLNPEKNKVYRFKSVSDQNVSQTVNGMEQNTHSVSSTYLSLKMLDATPEFYVMEARFDSIITKTNAMGKAMLITSASEGNMASKEAADVMSAVINKLCKNALYIKIDLTGKVRELVNYNMLSGIILKDTGLITGNTAQVLKQQVVNMVTPDALTLMIETFTYNLPNKEVKEGDTWEFLSPVNSGGMELEIRSDFSLVKLDGSNADVESESSIKTAANAKPMNYGGANITYDNLSGMGQATLTIDTQTGFMNSSHQEMNITGNLSLSVQGRSMEIPMRIESETAVTKL